MRSSATAEDLPDASFAGQQETFLNVRGIDAVLQAVREVYASLYNDRAIAYRVHHGFEHEAVSLSAGVQRMVRSDVGASGVLFTMDTESGFRDAVFVTSAYGLGEGVVQGAVNPDEFYVYKPALRAGRPAILKRGVGEKATKMVYTSHAEVGRTTEFVDVDPADRRLLSLTDDEVARAGPPGAPDRGALRPADGHRVGQGRPHREDLHPAGPPGDRAVAVGQHDRAVHGSPAPGTSWSRGGRSGRRSAPAPSGCSPTSTRWTQFIAGDVLVADMTDPDWEPIMKRASAIVTNRGGRTCHAAIIARELGIPAVVGTGTATRALSDGDPVTVSCAEGDTGFVYAGEVGFEVAETELDAMPEIPTKIMMNVGTPEQAFAFSRLPHAGVGLARLEFIINRQIGIHPRALLELDAARRRRSRRRSRSGSSPIPRPRDFFVQRVAEGISMIAAAFAPEPVIVRMSDFKSNEYANLLGGELYEPHEENPMLGYRGASRYLSADFAECFAMECEALRYVRDEMGLTNVKIMIPFVRTVAEIEGVVRAARRARPAPRGERPVGGDDVRAALQRAARRRLPRARRRVLDRLQRHDPAGAGPGPRLQPGGRRLRRARPGGAGGAGDGDQGLPGARQVRRHLRPGAQRPPRPGRVAGRAGHRVDVAEPGHRRRHLAAPGEDRRRGLTRGPGAARWRPPHGG